MLIVIVFGGGGPGGGSSGSLCPHPHLVCGWVGGGGRHDFVHIKGVDRSSRHVASDAVMW